MPLLSLAAAQSASAASGHLLPAAAISCTSRALGGLFGKPIWWNPKHHSPQRLKAGRQAPEAATSPMEATTGSLAATWRMVCRAPLIALTLLTFECS